MNWFRVAAVFGFLGVACGAFGAHALRGRVPDNLLDAFETGTRYHLIHAVVLLALACYGRATQVSITVPASLFCAGILLFSGSLYALALSGVTKLGMITPVGGLLLLGGWLSLALVRWA